MPKKNYSKSVKFFVFALILVGLIFWNPGRLFNPLEKVIFTVTYPLQKGFSNLGNGGHNLFSFLGSISDLKKENEEMIRENEFLKKEIANLRDVQKENEDMRSQLNLAPRSKFNLEASLIIGRDPQQSGSWVIIDKGSFSGIQTGMPVVAYQGILIGKISEVFPTTSRIDLLSSSQSVINALDSETEAKGVVRGEYSLGLVLDMVDQNDSIRPGDTVITSGLGEGVPRGFLIGKIEQVGSSRDKLFQQAQVAPEIKYQNLDLVFVVKK